MFSKLTISSRIRNHHCNCRFLNTSLDINVSNVLHTILLWLICIILSWEICLSHHQNVYAIFAVSCSISCLFDVSKFVSNETYLHITIMRFFVTKCFDSYGYVT